MLRALLELQIAEGSRLSPKPAGVQLLVVTSTLLHVLLRPIAPQLCLLSSSKNAALYYLAGY